MAKSAMIRARVEPPLKQDAEKVLDKLGMTPTEAITLFYSQVKLQRGLPFSVNIPNKETARAIRETRARKNVKSLSLAEFRKEVESLWRLAMRRVVRRNRFVKELQQIKRRNLDIQELLAVIDLLADDGAVRKGYNPHRLTGEWEGIWECHIEADWPLIYEVTDHEVILHRIGSHLDPFGLVDEI